MILKQNTQSVLRSMNGTESRGKREHLKQYALFSFLSFFLHRLIVISKAYP